MSDIMKINKSIRTKGDVFSLLERSYRELKQTNKLNTGNIYKHYKYINDTTYHDCYLLRKCILDILMRFNVIKYDPDNDNFRHKFIVFNNLYDCGLMEELKYYESRQLFDLKTIQSINKFEKENIRWTFRRLAQKMQCKYSKIVASIKRLKKQNILYKDYSAGGAASFSHIKYKYSLVSNYNEKIENYYI